MSAVDRLAMTFLMLTCVMIAVLAGFAYELFIF